jgi:hypothetical protein
MSRSHASRPTLLFAAWILTAVATCGLGDSKSTHSVSSICVLNNDCHNSLSCSFGRCHDSCQESRDCPEGQRCVLGQQGVNVCQLPEQQNCAYVSQCEMPLTCALDRQCRSECREDRDCPRGQKCVLSDGVCADMAELDVTGNLMNTIEGPVPAGPWATSDGWTTAEQGDDDAASDGPTIGSNDEGAPADGGSAGNGPMVPNVGL